MSKKTGLCVGGPWDGHEVKPDAADLFSSHLLDGEYFYGRDKREYPDGRPRWLFVEELSTKSAPLDGDIRRADPDALGPNMVQVIHDAAAKEWRIVKDGEVIASRPAGEVPTADDAKALLGEYMEGEARLVNVR